MKIANATFLTIPNEIEYFISFFLSITLKFENATKTQIHTPLRHTQRFVTQKNAHKLTITFPLVKYICTDSFGN